MAEPVDYDPPRDPLYRDLPLRHRTALPVLGVPVRFASNAPAVIEAVEEAFGGWRSLESAPHLVAGDEVTATIIVQPGDEGPDEHAEIYHRVIGGHRILFGSPGSVGYTDPDRREATAFVTAALVADRQHFRYAMLEALTLSLVTPQDRQPFHAAAIVRDGAALLLAGPSGVGKSTLALAAVREGARVLAEDIVFLQSRPTLRVWGLPGYLHLPPDGRRHFPELEELTPTIRANGKVKLAVDLEGLGALPDLPVVEGAACCFLQAGHDSPALEPVDGRAAVAAVMDGLEPGFDLFADTLREPLGLLLAPGAWRLRLSADPMAALPLLDELFERAGADG